MSVQNAGSIIREARLKAGLSQEKLSDGICSAMSLSRIENGSAGVSPGTFQTLMAHAGAPCEAYPIFANRTDFDCFYTLKRVRFFLNSWQLTSAYDELEKIEEMHWTKNKYYYQEWLLLHCKLQFRSGCAEHQRIYNMLSSAIQISRPDFHPDDIRDLLLSIHEIELFTALAQEALYLNKLPLCLELCTQISTYLTNSTIPFFEKKQLLAENAIVYTKYLIATHDYDTAFKTADRFRHQMVLDMNDVPLHELTFLTGLSLYYKGETDKALPLFKATFLSAHSIESCYATLCLDYAKKLPDIIFPEEILKLPAISLPQFAPKELIDFSSFGDGSYDLSSTETLSLGGIIRELRMEQKISQALLCQGLCSKSKLSKIENGTLQPEIALSQALLQRLGISDTVFTFLGNKHETQLYDLREKARHTKFSNHELSSSYISSMEELLTPKDTLYKQYALFKRSIYMPQNKKKIMQLHDALSLTLPDFDINHILDYRLSWMELTILNNLSAAYSDSSTPSIGIRYLYKILEYLDTNNVDILFRKSISTITITILFRRLYRQKRYSEILELRPLLSFSSSCVSSDIRSLANTHAHFCQSLGECGYMDEMILYANYSCGSLFLYEDTANIKLLYNYIKDDFQINVLY